VMRIHQASMFSIVAHCSRPFHTLIITSCTTSRASSWLPNNLNAKRKSLFFVGNTRVSKDSKFIVSIARRQGLVDVTRYRKNCWVGSFWAASGLFATSPRASMLKRSCGLFVSIPAARASTPTKFQLEIWFIHLLQKVVENNLKRHQSNLTLFAN
jgi:hypothetical protein